MTTGFVFDLEQFERLAAEFVASDPLASSSADGGNVRLGMVADCRYVLLSPAFQKVRRGESPKPAAPRTGLQALVGDEQPPAIGPAPGEGQRPPPPDEDA